MIDYDQCVNGDWVNRFNADSNIAFAISRYH